MNKRKKLLYFFFFLSGICGLVYEVLWARYLGLFIGNTTYAHTVVLASFMGGLALGNLCFGKWADRTSHWLTFYAWLEIGIGLYSAVTPEIFTLSRFLFLKLGQPLAIDSTRVQLLKFLLSFPVILLPTFLMGGTLPFLARAFIQQPADTKSEIARLYAVNSLGAIFGAVISAFLMIPKWGLDFSVLLAAITNIVIGVGVIAARSSVHHKKFEANASFESPVAKMDEASPAQLKLVFWVIGISGLTSMLYEVAWFRLFALVLGSSTYSFALMLAAFISGITLGSLWLSRPSSFPNRFPSYALLALSEMGIGIFISLSLPVYERLPYYFNQLQGMIVPHPHTFPIYELSKYLFCFVIMMIPTFFFGMTLPLASRLSSRNLEAVGKAIGHVFAVNTLGAVIGSLLAGFLLIPTSGLKGTFWISATTNVVLGIILLYRDPAIFRLRRLRTSFLFIPVIFVLGMGVATPSWSQVVLSSGTFRNPRIYDSFQEFLQSRQRKVIYYKDGAQFTVTVTQSKNGQLFLAVNGKTDASSKGDLKTEILLGQVPLLLHSHPQKVLNIGLGSGITCGSLLTHPISQLDVVEISKEVIEASRQFKDHNHEFYNDPRAHIYEEDAKTFLELSKQSYDVIVSEPSNPWMSGIGGLFSKEYFQNVKAHLDKGGIFVQWFHSYEMTDETVEMVVRTFASVFPHAGLWNSQTLDLLLVGTIEPLEISWESMNKKISSPEVAKELLRIDIADIPGFLIHEMISPARVRKSLTPGLVNSDYFPYLEYQAPKDFFYGGKSMEFFEKDERRRNPAAGNLLLSRYLKTHPLSRENLSHLYQTMDSRNMLHSLSELWNERFPRENFPANEFEEKNKTRLELAGLKAAILFYKDLMERNPGKLEYLKQYVLVYFDYYLKTRSIFYSPVMEDWFRYCERTIELSDNDKEKFYKLKSEVLYREGNFTGSMEALEKALAYLASKKETGGGKPFTPEIDQAIATSFLKTIVTRYLEEGKNEEALETLRKIQALDPKNSTLARFIRTLEAQRK